MSGRDKKSGSVNHPQSQYTAGTVRRKKGRGRTPQRKSEGKDGRERERARERERERKSVRNSYVTYRQRPPVVLLRHQGRHTQKIDNGKTKMRERKRKKESGSIVRRG